MKLNEFLTDIVEGRLFGDMTAMKSITCQPGQTTGAVGYPLLMAAFAGIELLGTLLSQSRFDKNQGASYFRDAWQRIYPDPQKSRLADIIYTLGRHGLAHLYAPKGPITVHKGNPTLHLQTTADTIDVDANQLADDLAKGYHGTIKPLLSTAAAAAEARLNEMQNKYQDETVAAFKKLLPARVPVQQPLPTAIAPAQPVPQDSTESPAASGSVFVHGNNLKPP